MKPLVSVIIPTYNREKFLKEAIESVLAQTFRSFELIVVDDASTDKTPYLVSRYPLRYVRKVKRQGVSAARNTGIRLAQGEFIAFLDSDDLWLPEKLAEQIAFFERRPEAVAVQTEEIWIRRGKRVNPRKRHEKPSGYFFDRALELCLISPSGVMLKRKVFREIGLFDESFLACEDYELWLRLLTRYPVFLIEKPLVIKRGGHEDQLSATPGLDYFRLKALAKIYRDPLLTPAMRLLVIKEAKRKGNIYLKGALKRGKLYQAFEVEQIFKKMMKNPGLPSILALSRPKN
ncbi:glycosyl transferase family 2 [Thermodesulfatator indicus DSM 15286]|uniref:Glycosyl transferase family 2 n=1 Tax=Thermodesulfatator indicus (strain DSM 15286 / JCM 11887 / CIR29812) TaxID=667014 RepID=F8ADF0_THEID|nr:glycosyltransferase [Thermodesulfatator indicus]AEH45966.1 glycosyl transferase family 2 [Thermodesulfatator indicus DSM 15286]